MDGFLKVEIENQDFTIQIKPFGRIEDVYHTEELIEEDVTQSDWESLASSETDFLIFKVGISPNMSRGFPETIPVPSDFSLELAYFTDDGPKQFTRRPLAEKFNGWLGIDYDLTGEIRNTTTWPTSPDGFGVPRSHLAFDFPKERSIDEIHRLKLICNSDNHKYTCWLAGGEGLIMPQDRA